MREELRDLHGPDTEYGLTCSGCDSEGFESEAPAWPCRTAQIVYTAEEIDYITTSYRWWVKWGRERRRRQKLASGWAEPSLVQAAYAPMLKTLLAPSPFFDALLRPADGPTKSATFRIIRPGENTG